jgi:TonB family protein
METIALYLFRSVVWLTGFTVIYFLFLRNERFFMINRIFLLSGIIASLLFPLLTISYAIEVSAPQNVQSGTAEALSVIPLNEGWFPGSNTVLITLYVIGAVVVTFLFGYKSRAVIKSIKKAEVISSRPVKILRTDDYTSSFSFFSWVFVNPSVSDTEAREIVNHEMVHVSQKHWADLLLGELLCILQWFNPLSWVYIHYIRQNHEFLADEGALQRSPDPALYRAALLNQVIGLPVFSVSNSFNYSQTKKRFKMMKNIATSPYRKLRILMILPVMAAILVAFAKPEYKFTQGNGVQSAITSAVGDQDQNTVKGVVVQKDGKPLEGAVVLVKASTIGTGTDSKGAFTLSNIPSDATLVVSFVGFKTKVVKPVFKSSMKIEMVRDTIEYKGGGTPPPPPPPADNKKVTAAGGGQKVVKGVYMAIEELPQFPGGEEALIKWIGDNVKYPGEAVKNSITGKVFVDFIIGTDGKISNVKVTESIHPLLDAEAVRVISRMPAWKPGTQSGKPVDVYMKIPIDFKLN